MIYLLDDEEDPQLHLPSSGIMCPICGEDIGLTDEAIHVWMREACWHEGKLWSQPLPEDPARQPMPPYFFHLGCWEEAESDLYEVVADVPPLQSRFQVCPCSVCGSSIDQCLPHAVYVVVELHSTHRGKRGGDVKIETLGKQIPVCLPCVARLTTTCLEAWEDGVLHLLKEFEEYYENMEFGI